METEKQQKTQNGENNLSPKSQNDKVTEILLDVLDRMFPQDGLLDGSSIYAKKFKLLCKRIIYLEWDIKKLKNVLQYFIDHHKLRYWMPADIINLGKPEFNDYGDINFNMSYEVRQYTGHVNTIKETDEDRILQEQDDIMHGRKQIPDDWHLDEATGKYVPNE